MDQLIIEKTDATPRVCLDADRHRIEARGYSYPENAASFYAPILKWLRQYLERRDEAALKVEMEMVYFNSSSSKVLMDVFELLDAHAGEGRIICVEWIYDGANESAYECGLEFKECVENLDFTLVRKSEEADPG